MSAPRLSELEKREIVKAYRRGDPIKEIALRFGVHQSYPVILAKRRGAKIFFGGRAPCA
jgi:transposase-like protein